MIDIWNRIIRHKLYPEIKASLTARREETLIWFLEEILGPEISWEVYCKLISRHGFLGKVTLDWALVPDNARKVLAIPSGEESDHLEPLKDIPWADFYEGIRQRCQRSPYGLQWFQICQNLAKRVGQRIYTTWFAGASLVEFTENTVVIQVGSAFKRDYILAYFFLDVAYAVQIAYPSVNQIDFQVGSSPLNIPSP